METSIKTERLYIRNFEIKDAEGLFAYLSQPRVNCFMDEQLRTLEEAVADVERRGDDDLQYAVCLKKEDSIIGNVFAMKEEPDTYSVGWHFNEQYQGKGYASEAARAFLDFLFTNKGARRIYAYVEENNIRSQKLCERLDMRNEGLFIDFISFIKNSDGTPKYENTFIYAILKKDWELCGMFNVQFSKHGEVPSEAHTLLDTINTNKTRRDYEHRDNPYAKL
ncbi:MAG: GNAT family N-acetyltransferase [Desulfovibrionaceae bacterium]|nr:GNAT family N-acetyltransferase [Desulfovibrionaceae bacterium]